MAWSKLMKIRTHRERLTVHVQRILAARLRRERTTAHKAKRASTTMLERERNYGYYAGVQCALELVLKPIEHRPRTNRSSTDREPKI